MNSLFISNARPHYLRVWFLSWTTRAAFNLQLLVDSSSVKKSGICEGERELTRRRTPSHGSSVSLTVLTARAAGRCDSGGLVQTRKVFSAHEGLLLTKFAQSLTGQDLKRMFVTIFLIAFNKGWISWKQHVPVQVYSSSLSTDISSQRQISTWSKQLWKAWL